MVIPLTHVALILKAKKKNKRKTMMNNIRNTMCRLSDLTQGQIDSLVYAMPDSKYYQWGAVELLIGFHEDGNSGTWAGFGCPKIVTYTEMMQLLKGKDMNKQTAQEQMAVMQIEMDKLKAIIDKPEVKTGRVLGLDCLKRNAEYWYVWNSVEMSSMDSDEIDKSRIQAGNAFYDKETAERHLEYLKLEQELRRAQAADGEATGYERYNVIFNGKDRKLHTPKALVFHEKISFNTEEARDKFRNTHTDEQLTLLIRGV
jgi:hypothetical protein